MKTNLFNPLAELKNNKLSDTSADRTYYRMRTQP